MARTQKYSGDLLLEATLQYSEICAGKIKYVELAEWASANIPGLEGVKDYHFSRPMVVVDKAGGKKTVVKECTQRVMELNKARSVAVNMESNPLIKSSRIDDFLDMPRQKQVHIILQTRNQFESAMKSSRYAEMEHNRVQQENRLLRESQIEMERNLKALSDKQIEFGDALRKLKKYINDELRKKALESIGLIAGKYYDLEKFYLSMNDDIEVMFMEKDRTTIERSSLRDAIIAGINFGNEYDEIEGEKYDDE